VRSIYNQPGAFIVRVAGVVDAKWSERLGGLTITVCETTDECIIAVSELTGWLADQAALYGVLNTLYDNRYPLLYVEYLGPAQEARKESLGAKP